MRNELKRLVQTVSDPAAKRVSLATLSLHSHLTGFGFKKDLRYGNAVFLLPLHALSHRESPESGTVHPSPLLMVVVVLTTSSDWDRIKSPAADQIIPYDKLPKVTSPDALNKLAVLKVNGGLGTSMGRHRFDFLL